MNPTSFVLKFLNQETAIISGSGVAITSANLAVYGVHHEILFLFVFANMLAIFTLLIYKLSGHNFPFLPARPSDEYEFDEEEYSEEEYDY
jgi:hypothetical protein